MDRQPVKKVKWHKGVRAVATGTSTSRRELPASIKDGLRRCHGMLICQLVSEGKLWAGAQKVRDTRSARWSNSRGSLRKRRHCREMCKHSSQLLTMAS